MESNVRHLSVQMIFLLSGVFSTCTAQYLFYIGAGDQRTLLLPLCNYLGMMLVGLIPLKKENTGKAHGMEEERGVMGSFKSGEQDSGDNLGSDKFYTLKDSSVGLNDGIDGEKDCIQLTRRSTTDVLIDFSDPSTELSNSISSKKHPSYFAYSTVQLCVILSVILDFAGCIFSNVGLSMAGSGLYQVVYSSVICWSAFISRFALKKVVSKEQWTGIALVTFGLAYSAMGESKHGDRGSYAVLMGCLYTLIAAGFYGANYVTGEYMLMLPERPQPNELCLQIGTVCVVIAGLYQMLFVLPKWNELITIPVQEANGSSLKIVMGLFAYTLSQLAHGLTYFMVLKSSGAVTTGIMQSLRAVCVFALSSILYCEYQDSQCFDTKRAMATLIVVSGVLFYSWAKSLASPRETVAFTGCTSRSIKNHAV